MNRAQLYSNILVKVGASRSDLVSENKLKACVACRNLKEFTSELRETIYGEKLAQVAQPYTSKKFERVFREHLLEVSCSIVKNSPKVVSQFLKMSLLKFERENVKTILKAVSVGLPYEEIKDKVYMTVEDFLENRNNIEKAAMAIHVKSVVENLKTMDYGALLGAGLREYEETGSTKSFDILLDRTFYEQLGEAFEKLPKKEQDHAFFYVSTETDSFNLLTILRAKILNYDSHRIRMIISRNSYNVSEQTMEALLMAKDFESAFNIVKQSYYSKSFVKADAPEETISIAEKTFKKALLEHARKTRIGDPFNVGMILSFMVQKEVEVYNLIATSLGITYGWKPDEILRLLLL